MNDQPMSQLGVRIPRDLHKRLKLFCVEREREMQGLVEEAIREKLDRLEAKPGKK